jgi:hypothetical protein
MFEDVWINNMDAIASISNQWKVRENKMFSHRAEAHANEMKEVSSVPKIDPLSRKVAEIVTKRELEMLGIAVQAPAAKKPLISSANILNSKPDLDPLSRGFISKDISPIESPTKDPGSYTKPTNCRHTPEPIFSPSKQEPQTKVILKDLKSPLEEGKMQASDIEIPAKNLTKADFPSEPGQDIKKTHEDMLNNVEHMKAFREELHRDYPELGLDNSVGESSFHTNELNELEEACKNLNLDIDLKTPKAHEERKNEMLTVKEVTIEASDVDDKRADFAQDLKKSDIDQLSNVSAYEKKTCVEIKPDKKTPGVGLETNSRTENKSRSCKKTRKSHDIKDVINSSARGKYDRSANSGSKFQSVMSVQEAPSKDFLNLQNSYFKASFLHSPQEPVSVTVPRCHVNLTACKSSPIYQNVRVPKDSRVKCDNGIALVDSLRRLFLQPAETVKQNKPKGFYEKNVAWANRKNEKTQRIRESVTEREVQNCTFDPFTSRQSHRKTQKSMDYRMLASKSKSSLDIKDLELKSHTRTFTEIPSFALDNLIVYSALSPADTKVGFNEGCAIERLLEKSKPMVNYRSINFLN